MSTGGPSGSGAPRGGRGLGAAATLGLLLAPALVRDPFLLDTLFVALLFAYAATAWDLLGGFTGPFSLGHAAFFAIGAYTSTLLFNGWGVSPWIGMAAGGVLAAGAAAVLGTACFRFGIGGHYFALFTIGFGEIARVLLTEIEWFGGANGVSVALARPGGLWAMQFVGRAPFVYIMEGMLAGLLLLQGWLLRARIGHWCRAVRDDERAAEAAGIDTLRVKLAALTASAFVTATGGTVYAQYYSFIGPETVAGVPHSIRIAAAAAIGGMGTRLGPALGACLVTALSTGLRVGLGIERGAALDGVVYSVVLAAIVLRLPEGVLPGLRAALRRRPAPA